MCDAERIESERRALRSALARFGTPERRFRENDDAAYDEPAMRATVGLFDDLDPPQRMSPPRRALVSVVLAYVVSAAFILAVCVLLVRCGR